MKTDTANKKNDKKPSLDSSPFLTGVVVRCDRPDARYRLNFHDASLFPG